jgi:hypothetical protein
LERLAQSFWQAAGFVDAEPFCIHFGKSLSKSLYPPLRPAFTRDVRACTSAARVRIIITSI